MNDEIFNDLAIEQLVKAEFGLQVDVKQVIVREIPISHTAIATVFLTPKHQLFGLLQAKAPMALGDVRKMCKRMGLIIEAYLPPHHNGDYFDAISREKFRAVFPSRHNVDESELRFYKLLAPYNPALVKIDAIDGGVIKQFDSHDSSQWRTAAKFTYKQIVTQ